MDSGLDIKGNKKVSIAKETLETGKILFVSIFCCLKICNYKILA